MCGPDKKIIDLLMFLIAGSADIPVINKDVKWMESHQVSINTMFII